MTTWTGTWRNQYGSEVVITDDAGGELRGTFRTAIVSSPFAGQDVPLVGVHGGSTVAFSSAVEADGGSASPTPASSRTGGWRRCGSWWRAARTGGGR